MCYSCEDISSWYLSLSLSLTIHPQLINNHSASQDKDMWLSLWLMSSPDTSCMETVPLPLWRPAPCVKADWLTHYNTSRLTLNNLSTLTWELIGVISLCIASRSLMSKVVQCLMSFLRGTSYIIVLFFFIIFPPMFSSIHQNYHLMIMFSVERKKKKKKIWD